MPSLATTTPAAGGDDLDNLFDYDVPMDDVFKDPSKHASRRGRDGDNGPIGGVNIDEEVQIKKQRKPIPKLDEARLLSDKGIPRLRKISKERLKFKGKGHEYKDIERLLTHYQLWLDELFPRAKFRDALILVEALGHKKTMQMMRKQWIDEGKPRLQTADSDVDEDFDPRPAHTVDVEDAGDTALPLRQNEMMSGALPSGPNDDELEALLAGEEGPRTEAYRRQDDQQPNDDELDLLLANEDDMRKDQSARPRERDDGPNEDELDMLLAQESSIHRASRFKPSRGNDPPPDDDLDALLAGEDTLHNEIRPRKTADVPDDADLDALLADEDEIVPASTLKKTRPEPDDDDLNALLAEDENT